MKHFEHLGEAHAAHHLLQRRAFLRMSGASILGTLGGAGLLTALGSSSAATAGDYKALVCLVLNGGNDGHNTLVPTDGAYSDYQTARPILALPKESLAALNGNSAGHTFGLHPALAPLAGLYNQRRLAFIANTGPLVVPTTARQAIDHSVALPPFLMSHSDQSAITQGWGGDADQSGWVGRSLEKLPTGLVNSLNAVALDDRQTLVRGQVSRVAQMGTEGGVRWWGPADLTQPQYSGTQTLTSLSQWQFANDYEAEYGRAFDINLRESKLLVQLFQSAAEPQANFGADYLARQLRAIAKSMPAFKAQGYRRQVFMLTWGSFDTHYGQRGNAERTQDYQLDQVARALTAFDTANRAAGLDLDVTTLAMSEFGRTLRPASGAGSDHAWGNHWFAMGGAVDGGKVLGTFPTLTLGGPDDADPNKGGRFVPTTATDQVGATLMQWLGLPASAQAGVFSNLANFSTKTLALMRA